MIVMAVHNSLYTIFIYMIFWVLGSVKIWKKNNIFFVSELYYCSINAKRYKYYWFNFDA